MLRAGVKGRSLRRGPRQRQSQPFPDLRRVFFSLWQITADVASVCSYPRHERGRERRRGIELKFRPSRDFQLFTTTTNNAPHSNQLNFGDLPFTQKVVKSGAGEKKSACICSACVSVCACMCLCVNSFLCPSRVPLFVEEKIFFFPSSHLSNRFLQWFFFAET